jgi:hypothetical protein
MDVARLFLIVAGVVIAFRAGYAWRHHKRTWSDYNTIATGMKKLNKLRWKVLRDGLAAVGVLVLFIAVVTYATHLGEQTDEKSTPASVTRTAHKATPSPHRATPTPTRHTTR